MLSSQFPVTDTLFSFVQKTMRDDCQNLWLYIVK